MRLPRPQIENCCVHVTHRCQERQYLLPTDIDRKQYVKRLWQASRRFRILLQHVGDEALVGERVAGLWTSAPGLARAPPRA